VFFEKSSNMGRTPDFPQNEQIAREKLSKYADKCEWLIKRSDEVDIPKVDFVYIDGSHEYENVIKDLHYFWYTLKPGGILAGHDWHSPGVRRAVEEFAERRRMGVHVNKPDWVFYK
jgi:predicted O-methyltransferase YrrM